MGPIFELRIAPAPIGSRRVAGHLLEQLRAAILAKRLVLGSRLPSTRSAQVAFGVSRNTAQEVYERLANEGLVRLQRGSGAYVKYEEPLRIVIKSADALPSPCELNPFWCQPETAAWIGFWQERLDEAGCAAIADLRPAIVDQHLFPHALFRRAMAKQLRMFERREHVPRSAQNNQGSRALRCAIAEHIGLTRAVACDHTEVVVTSGAQQAFDLLARALVVPGKTVVAVEDPGYPPMRVPFAAAGARIVPVRVDKDGIVVDEIPQEAGVICVCPSHQFPLGMPMSVERRESLIRFAAGSRAAIVEDDYDGEFRHQESPIEALRASHTSESVFYVGSFSKSMFPALRLGFLISPRWALSSLVAAKNASDWNCSVPIQESTAEFIRAGHLARHIRKARRVYGERRDYLRSQLSSRLGHALDLVPSFYGMHLAAFMRAGMDADTISRALAAEGIMVHSLSRYYLGPMQQNGLVFGFGAADLATLEIALVRIAQLME